MQQIYEITIDGKQVGLYFGLGCVMKASESVQKLTATDERVFEGLSEVILAAHENYCVLKRCPMTVEWEAVYLYVNSVALVGGVSELMKIIEPFTDAIVEMSKSMADASDKGGEPKKKAVRGVK